jgi:hypothetical protein
MPSTSEDLPQKLLSQFGKTLNESLSNTKTKNYMTLLWKYFNTQNKCDKPKMFFLKLQMDMSDRNLYIFQFEKAEWKLHITF